MYVCYSISDLPTDDGLWSCPGGYFPLLLLLLPNPTILSKTLLVFDSFRDMVAVLGILIMYIHKSMWIWCIKTIQSIFKVWTPKKSKYHIWTWYDALTDFKTFNISLIKWWKYSRSFVKSNRLHIFQKTYVTWAVYYFMLTNFQFEKTLLNQ